jgi:hypothetical protein
MTVPSAPPSPGLPGEPALARDERTAQAGSPAQTRSPAQARDEWNCLEPDWLGPEPEEPTDAELFGLAPNPFAGPPDGADAWLAELSAAELEALAEKQATEDLANGGPIGAGFCRDLPSDAAAGFGCGGPLDLLEPGRMLAGSVADAFSAGLGDLPDDQLVGLLLASRRLSSWQAGIELAAIAELDTRRRRTTTRNTSATHDHITAEVAAALVLSHRPAEEVLDLARGIARLPGVEAALLAGLIDRDRAAVFVAELAMLDKQKANAIANAFTAIAGKMTTGQLRRALRHMVLSLFPETARERAEKARKFARVEAWPELSGNGALAGRELSQADMIAADQRITAIADALKAAGAPGTLGELRAAVFTALLTGRDPAALAPGTASPRDTGQGPDHLSPGQADGQGDPSSADPGPADQSPADQSPADQSPANPGPADSGPADIKGDRRDHRPGQGIAALTGSVHLTMPVSAWLGLSDAPGEVVGYGPLDADTCRDLVERIAAGPRSTWCVTLTDPSGHAAAHACARAGPGSPRAADQPDPPPGSNRPPRPPGPPPRSRRRPGPPSPGRQRPPASPPRPRSQQPPGPPSPAGPAGHRAWPGEHAWVRSLSFDWLESGTCSHERRTASYRPGRALRHLVKVRNRTCVFPGCRRPARRCDLDHTTPYDQGGPTCECNLSPLCRKHHQVKQEIGWHLVQTRPGTLIWTAPHGRSYIVRPDPY